MSKIRLYFPLVLVLLLLSVCTIAQNTKDANGKRQGKWTITAAMKKNPPGYSADAVIEEGEYKDNRKTGLWISYYPNGKKKAEITHKLGRPAGPYTTYYKNGVVQEKGNWKMNRNTGDFKRYHPNGKVSQEFAFNATGKREGNQKYYHENGQLAIEGNWAGGKESGEVVSYYENGEVKSRKFFNEGGIDAAKSKNYDPQKAVAKADPVPEPEVKKAAPKAASSDKPNIGVFNGNGQHTLYNRNRQISQKGIFKNGYLYDGKSYKYTDGILTAIEIYKAGRFVGNGVIEDSDS